MSNIDKRALRKAAEKATPGRIGDRIDGSGSIKYQCFGNDGSLVLQTDHKNMEYGFIGENSEADELFFRMCDPATVLALLDELEAKDKRIAELSHHLHSAHVFIEHTEAFGHAASNGILCCGDAQWNIDESKSALAAAGKGEES
ncbi:ead/Ea22-like family protein [Enterobacter roggenkampii]|uniref:ead/Ea22-like family protein n=1 Tax=Enterobacter roggenkampii TaxID=1812935 RepID=UPI0018C2D70E|nr:ead/Ea22-like family protein [Enterobacter roggenkampii]MBG0660359.1 ead/Ea22-like family protein [Enterobacter roggenkampii]